MSPAVTLAPRLAAAVDEEILEIRGGVSSQLQAADDGEDVGAQSDGQFLLLAALPRCNRSAISPFLLHLTWSRRMVASPVVVLGRVRLAAPLDGQVDQPDGGREHALPGQRSRGRPDDGRPWPGSSAASGRTPAPGVEFPRSATCATCRDNGTPPPAASVPTAWLCLLDRGRAHVFPRRRDDQRLDAGQRFAASVTGGAAQGSDSGTRARSAAVHSARRGSSLRASPSSRISLAFPPAGCSCAAHEGVPAPFSMCSL